MGFKLAPLLNDSVVNISQDTLRDKVIAFDSFNEIYKFVSFVDKTDVSDILIAFFSRTVNMMLSGIRPVHAVEGIDINDIRSNQCGSTEKVIFSTVKLLDLIGIPLVKSPLEGEAQATVMVNRGDAYAVASTDYDALLFGADRMIIDPDSQNPVLISLDDVLKELKITHAQLVDASILAGNDYHDGIDGVGVKTAVEMIQKHGKLERVIDFISMNMKEVNDAREMFFRPPVNHSYTISWEKPRYNIIRSFLVNDMGCDPQHVDEIVSNLKRVNLYGKQKAMDEFFS